MIEAKTLQNFIKSSGVSITVDGVFGPMSHEAARKVLIANGVAAGAWTYTRIFIGIQQLFLNKTQGTRLVVDGINGPITTAAIVAYEQKYEVESYAPQATIWPRQSAVESYFGPMGENQVYVQCPYTLYGDYQRTIKVNQFKCHRFVAPSVRRILLRTQAYYGAEKIRRYNLDIFSGCFVVRRIVGGVGYSMHSWGIAIDWDAAHNEFNESRTTANFAEPRYEPWLDFWEDEGWLSLGRARNYDWMHVQAARL